MSSLGIFNKETKTYQKVAGTAQAAVVDTEMSDSSTKPVQNKVVKKYVDEKAKENVTLTKTTSKTLNGTIEAPLVLSKATQNLLRSTLATTTQNGVTCTANDDDSYTLSGTATAATTFTLCSNATVYAGVGTKVKFLGGSTNAPISATIDSITLTEGSVYALAGGTITAAINVASGTTLNNEVVKPMLTPDLEATTDNFVTGSAAYIPYTTGKNLIPYPYDGTEGNSNGITWTVNEDGSVTANGTATIDKGVPYSLIYHYNANTRKKLKFGKTYTLSDGLTDQQHANIGYMQLVLLDTSKSGNYAYPASTAVNPTYTANNKDTLEYGIRLIIRKDATANNLTFKPMLTEGLDEPGEFRKYENSGYNIAVDALSEFPLYGLKTFPEQTHIFFEGADDPNVETYIVNDESGKVLMDAITDLADNKLDASAVVNNQTTNVSGYALDARQANPNIDGTLAKQLSDLNGSLNDVATKNDISALNPSGAIKSYKYCRALESGEGWYRFAEIICSEPVIAIGAEYQYIEALIRQSFSNSLGCFHKVSLYLVYDDKAKMVAAGQGTHVLSKVRAVRKDNIIFLDVYSRAIRNTTELLVNIPIKSSIISAKCVGPYLVPETSDGEIIVCSIDLKDNI